MRPTLPHWWLLVVLVVVTKASDSDTLLPIQLVSLASRHGRISRLCEKFSGNCVGKSWKKRCWLCGQIGAASMCKCLALLLFKSNTIKSQNFKKNISKNVADFQDQNFMNKKCHFFYVPILIHFPAFRNSLDSNVSHNFCRCHPIVAFPISRVLTINSPHLLSFEYLLHIFCSCFLNICFVHFYQSIQGYFLVLC